MGRASDPEHRYNMVPLTWEKGCGGTMKVTIDGLEVIISGEVYDEARKTWQPIGLMEVKPRECEFNLRVTRASLHGLPRGTCSASGTVTLENAAMPERP